MTHKVFFLSMFLFILSCKPSDKSIIEPASDIGSYSTKPLKNLSFENQIIELYNIFKIAQTSMVPEETMNAILPAIIDKRLELVKDFVAEYSKRSPDYINDKYLSKPDKSTLEVVYYLFEIGYDSYSRFPLGPSGIIERGTDDVSDRDLLFNYYKVLFLRMQRLLSQQDNSDYSINFNQLSLDIPEEAAMLYYNCMFYFGRKYNRMTRLGCDKANAFAALMPQINGQVMMAFKLPNYQSYDIVYDKMKGRISITDNFESQIQLAKDKYADCN